MLSENAMKVLKNKKYFKNNESTWDDICLRVSKAIAAVESDKENQKKIEDQIYKAMINLEFIFSTPCLLNANIENPGQLSSCFVLPIKDDIDDIFNCFKSFAKIFQKNGGAGTNLSAIRPVKSMVETSGGYASGTTGFMSGFNWIADELTKYNEARKGAVKLDLAVWHPDILEFISIKHNTNELQRMNISVAITDDFILAVENNDEWHLIFPDYSYNKEIYNSEWDGNIEKWKSKGYPVKIYQKIKARELLDKIAYEAWYSGEPGISYQSNMDRGNKNKHLSSSVYGNPCHEFVNIPYSSCNLGSHNLAKYVDNGAFDYLSYSNALKLSVRWMDNMITVNKLPIKDIDVITKGIRPIGLGTMGLAHCLYLMGLKYNSEKTYKFVDQLYKFTKEILIQASVDLAKERGVYPLFEGSEWEKEGIKIRNSSLLSIAPNGTLGIIAGTTGGVEPQFSLLYSRRTDDGSLYYEIDPYFKKVLLDRGLYSDELLIKIEKNHGSCQGIKEIPQDIQDIFVVSHDISPAEHIKMVGVIQPHVDLSISKTANFSTNATLEDIKNIIILGYKSGCKGITVYRDGSRENQTLAVTRKEDNKTQAIFDTIEPVNKDDLGETFGTSIKRKVACGNLHINVFRDSEGNLAEIFINTSRGGICQSNVNAISRLVSLLLRGGIKVDAICNQLKDIKCPACSILRKENKNIGISCADVIGRYLEEKYLQETVTISEKKIKTKSQKTKKEDKNKCPNCGEKLRMESGCCICNCGFSRCG